MYVIKRLAFVLLILLIRNIGVSELIDPVTGSESLWVPRVVNGRPAKLGDVPYQIGFKRLSSIRRRYYTFCGGSLITPKVILSAAHCFEMNNGLLVGNTICLTWDLTDKFAVAGNLNNTAMYHEDGEGGGQWRKLAVVISPLQFNFPNNDICIVKTDRRFYFNKYVEPIPYAQHYKEYKGECLASGYGQITGTYSTLKGDSGGPLICSGTGHENEGRKGILVGIVSGNRKGAGSFFTRVSSYSDFLQENNSHKAILSMYCLLSSLTLIIFFRLNVFNFFLVP